MRILIAEDERDLNQIITERLKKEHALYLELHRLPDP